jgi:hypothetical protein
MTITVYPPMPTQDWYLAVARGQIAGTSQVNIYGYQDALTTGSFYPVWENVSAYTYPATASTMLLYSSSASDTNVSIFINGLDSSYNLISEVKILTNGTTGVTTTNSYLRINSISVSSSTSPVGTIYLGNAGKTVTYAQINLTGGVSAGRNQAAIYTVPNGYTFYLTRVNAFSNDASASKYMDYRVYTKNNTTGVSLFIQQAPFIGNYSVMRVSPRPYAAKTDIQWQCLAVGSTFQVSVAVEGVLIQGS